MMEDFSDSYQAQDFGSTTLLGSHSTSSSRIPGGSQRSWRRSVFVVFGAFLLVGILMLLPTSGQSSLLHSFPSFFMQFSEEEQEIEQTIRVAAYNLYTLRDGPAGAEYGWLEGHLLAEPYRTTYFSIVSPNENYVYESKIINSKTGEIELTSSAIKFNHVFENLQDRKLEVSSFERTNDGELRLLESSSNKIYVRYIRREIRALFEDDLEELLDTMRTLWDVEQTEGVELYGDQYMSVTEMHKFHLKYAAAPDCDHLHDGYGFITQHLALTNVFEQSLQAVNPKVSLPYWDYVMDFQENFLDNGEDFSNFENQGLFTEKYFGGTEVSTGKIKDGRWEGLEVPYIWEVGLTDEEMEVMPSNAYGHMRSPWSNNPVKHVQRSSKTCGVDTSIGYDLPTCEIISNLQALNSLEDWMAYISYKPHGPTHVQVGGTLYCEDAYNSLSHYFPDSKRFEHFVSKAYAYHEGAYRTGFIVCATKDKKCFCPEEENYKTLDDIYSDFADILGCGDCADMPREFLEDFVSVICNSGLVEGDNAQSSSSYTPEFWAIHPEVERFYLKKRILQDFESLDWPEGESWLGNVEDCYGHRWDDLVLMGTALLNTAQGEIITPTNVEFLAMLSTQESSLPYIYDNLKWDYCSTLGYEI